MAKKYLGHNKGKPWAPYVRVKKSDMKFNYWECGECNTVLYSSTPEVPECQCDRDRKAEENKLINKIITACSLFIHKIRK